MDSMSPDTGVASAHPLSLPGDWEDRTDPGVQVVDRRFVVHQPVDRCSCAVLYNGFDLAEQKPIEFFLECQPPEAKEAPRLTIDEVMSELRERFPGRGPLSAHGLCADGRRYIVLSTPKVAKPAPVTAPPAATPGRSVSILAAAALGAVLLILAGVRWVDSQSGAAVNVSTPSTDALTVASPEPTPEPAPTPEPEPVAAPEPIAEAKPAPVAKAAPAPAPAPAKRAAPAPVPEPEPVGSAAPVEASEPAPAPEPEPAADPYGEVDIGDDYMGIPDDYGKAP